jgi:hypothetical protein
MEQHKRTALLQRYLESNQGEERMKWIPSPFKSDVVEFTWLDLLRLALGMELRDSALVARRARRKNSA